jgi:polysaccharide pyruvyl transferase WcaK-like protein
MQIAIVNVSSDCNRGSCALTWASIHFVSSAFPEASIALVPLNESETPPDPPPFRHTMRRHPDISILPPLFVGDGKPALGLLWRLVRSLSDIFRLDRERPNANPTLEWIRNCDLVVSGGGVKFQTLGGRLRHDARFLTRLLPLLAAWKVDAPTVFVGAQVGPFDSWLGGRLFSWFASKAAKVFPRDRVSEFEVRRQVARVTDDNCVLMPDSAFALKFPVTAANAVFEKHGLDPGVATLALVISCTLRADESEDAHVAVFAEIANRLVASGHVGQIIIVVQEDTDRPISRKLARELRLDARFLIDDDLNPEELSSLYGVCRMVVSSRLHGVILAMLAGMPAISLAPEVWFKEQAVLDLLGLGSLWVPSRLGPAGAAEKCLAIAGDLDGHRDAVVAAVAAGQAQLSEVPRHLREAAGSRRELVP